MFRLLPRTTFASALLLSGGTGNHAVVDRPHPELKTYEDQLPDLGKPGFPCLFVENVQRLRKSATWKPAF